MIKVIDLYGATNQFDKDNTKVFIGKDIKVTITKNKQCSLKTSKGTYSLKYSEFNSPAFHHHKHPLYSSRVSTESAVYEGVIGKYEVRVLHKVRFAEFHYVWFN